MITKTSNWRLFYNIFMVLWRKPFALKQFPLFETRGIGLKPQTSRLGLDTCWSLVLPSKTGTRLKICRAWLGLEKTWSRCTSAVIHDIYHRCEKSVFWNLLWPCQTNEWHQFPKMQLLYLFPNSKKTQSDVILLGIRRSSNEFDYFHCVWSKCRLSCVLCV
jgi:hypothetical protein